MQIRSGTFYFKGVINIGTLVLLEWPSWAPRGGESYRAIKIIIFLVNADTRPQSVMSDEVYGLIMNNTNLSILN